MITAPDDNFARTHDDAQSLLRYAVPGAHVEFWKPPTASDRSRAYTVTLRRWGRPDVAEQGAYTLPAPADALARSAIDAANRAARG